MKNRFFVSVLVGALSACLALPAFANRTELYNLMMKDDNVNAERLAEELQASGDPYGTCVIGTESNSGAFRKRDAAKIRKLLSACPGVADGGAIVYARYLLQGVGGAVDSVSAGRVLAEMLPRDKSGRANIEYAMWLSQPWDGAPRPANRRELIALHGEKAASLGQQNAFVRLGLMHNYGSTDHTQGAQSASLRQDAIGWFRRAGAEQNNREGMLHYLKLTGLDQKLASRELPRYVEIVGARLAMGELAYQYLGRGVLPQNLPESRYWAENGTLKEERYATYVLGVLTRDGAAGIPPNPQKAVELFERAHKLNAEIAASDLAGMYATGKHIPQDLVKARQWLQAGLAAAPDEKVKADYAQRIRLFDEIKGESDSWARRQAQQMNMSSEDRFLLGIVAFGAALAAKVDANGGWTRAHDRGEVYTEKFDFDKHQKQVYCSSTSLGSFAHSFGGC